MVAMAIGVLFSNRVLRGSCGGEEVLGPDGNPLSCGACPRKERDICPSDDAVASLAQVGYPNPRH
ncbi:MAG: hypothetical protein EA397_03070 [Deltaproteobacteria bacterium]|nr:MAG: hypothetical protein EA397_03070 [Deltaproteobacteria bacterium]